MYSQLQSAKQLIVGAASVKETDTGIEISRLPEWVADRLTTDPILKFVASNGSGVRLSTLTRASKIVMKLMLTEIVIGEMPRQPVSAVVVINGTEKTFEFLNVANTLNPLAPGGGRFSSEPSVIEFELETGSLANEVEIWFPQNCAIIISELMADAKLTPPAPAGSSWVHYGSSISHCGEADGPLGVWPVLAARELGLNIYNLGLAGQAQLDQFAARTIAELKPDFVSLKIGINTVNANSLNARTYPHAVHGFIDTIRDTLPEAPILVSTPIFCPPHELGFAPTIFDPIAKKAKGSPQPTEFFPATLNLLMVRELTESVVKQRQTNDPNLYLMSGLDLFGESDSADLPDDLHPNAEGYKRMGRRFASHPVVQSWLAR